jgi:hypothetical protein
MDCYGHSIFISHFFLTRITQETRQMGKNDGRKKRDLVDFVLDGPQPLCGCLVSIHALLDTSYAALWKGAKKCIFDDANFISLMQIGCDHWQNKEKISKRLSQ